MLLKKMCIVFLYMQKKYVFNVVKKKTYVHRRKNVKNEILFVEGLYYTIKPTFYKFVLLT